MESCTAPTVALLRDCSTCPLPCSPGTPCKPQMHQHSQKGRKTRCPMCTLLLLLLTGLFQPFPEQATGLGHSSHSQQLILLRAGKKPAAVPALEKISEGETCLVDLHEQCHPRASQNCFCRNQHSWSLEAPEQISASEFSCSGVVSF